MVHVHVVGHIPLERPAERFGERFPSDMDVYQRNCRVSLAPDQHLTASECDTHTLGVTSFSAFLRRRVFRTKGDTGARKMQSYVIRLVWEHWDCTPLLKRASPFAFRVPFYG